MESEKKTEKHLAREMLALGGMSLKLTSPMVRGVPDRICIFPFGLTIFVEVKSENDKPKAHQERMMTLMRAKGALVYVVSTKAEVDALIKQYVEA